MDPMIRCAHCGRFVLRNPQSKEQRFCGRKPCQRVRKNLWQRQKMATDPDYQANQRDCQKRWRRQNKDYWRKYRSLNPAYRQRNRLMQKERDRKRRPGDLAKMDALNPFFLVKPGSYYLLPEGKNLAKMDALVQKVFLIPSTYANLAKKDAIDFSQAFL